MFDTYATGAYTVADIIKLVTSWSLRSHAANPLHRSNVYQILSHPFYVGLIQFKGELYEGSHEPLVSKGLFDRVQELLRKRSRPRIKAMPGFPFVGLLRCEECGCSITAEKQKGHTYYRCTKKRGGVAASLMCEKNY